jgi:hypothetical protein
MMIVLRRRGTNEGSGADAQTCSTRTRDSDSSPTRVQFLRDSDSRVRDSDLYSDSRVKDSDSGHPDTDSRRFYG